MSRAAIVAIFLQLYGAFGWQNNYDGPLKFECRNNEYLSGVRSWHHNRHEDRVWRYSCTRLAAPAQLDVCTWYNWYNNVNQMDGLLAFRCRGNNVITGVKSYHSNRHEDRVFSFRCCNVKGPLQRDCYFTGYLNNYDGWMDYIAPHNYAIVGFVSAHNSHHEDRRWKAEICKLS